ncbi:hypothetical protein MHYP_G00067600 [Metynnis hypsauchen]
MAGDLLPSILPVLKNASVSGSLGPSSAASPLLILPCSAPSRLVRNAEPAGLYCSPSCLREGSKAPLTDTVQIRSAAAAELRYQHGRTGECRSRQTRL